MGFDITEAQFQRPEGALTIRDMAHAALDQLLDRMISEGTDGGAAIIQTEDETYGALRFKMMFFNYTDEKDCAFCNGTGVDGS